MTTIQKPLIADRLTDWVIVTVQGPDSEKYLQGQCTIDLPALSADQHQLAAHCESKGKVWSTLRLFRYQNGFAYLLRQSVAQLQIEQLKKYAIFSKLTISLASELTLLAITGKEAKNLLQTKIKGITTNKASLCQNEYGYWLHFAYPQDRWLVISTPEQQNNIAKTLDVTINENNQRWLSAEIAAGLPVIDLVTSEQFIPQSLNLQALHGINFQKGCYTGQETVARAKYRGANKRALYCLEGKTQGAAIITAGEELALRLGDNWRKTGTILASCATNDNTYLIQAVLSNDLAADAQLRLLNDEQSPFTLRALPYSLE